MKRVILLCTMLVFIGSMFALESDPSEVVGYVKCTYNSGGYYATASTLQRTDMSIGAVFDGTYTDGESISYMNDGSIFFTYFAGIWYPAGADPGFVEGKGYWTNLTPDPYVATYDVYYTGKVDPQPIVFNIPTGYFAFALNEAKTVDIAAIGLPAIFSDGDTISDANDGSIFYVYYGGLWYPGGAYTTDIEPTHVYWLNNTTGSIQPWTYSPTDRVIVSKKGK